RRCCMPSLPRVRHRGWPGARSQGRRRRGPARCRRRSAPSREPSRSWRGGWSGLGGNLRCFRAPGGGGGGGGGRRGPRAEGGGPRKTRVEKSPVLTSSQVGATPSGPTVAVGEAGSWVSVLRQLVARGEARPSTAKGTAASFQRPGRGGGLGAEPPSRLRGLP